MGLRPVRYLLREPRTGSEAHATAKGARPVRRLLR